MVRVPKPRSGSVGAVDECADVIFADGGELEDLAPADERRVNRKERILRRRSDQQNMAGFNVGQKNVLLGAVETVDFVEEENGTLAGVSEAVAG